MNPAGPAGAGAFAAGAPKRARDQEATTAVQPQSAGLDGRELFPEANLGLPLTKLRRRYDTEERKDAGQRPTDVPGIQMPRNLTSAQQVEWEIFHRVIDSILIKKIMSLREPLEIKRLAKLAFGWAVYQCHSDALKALLKHEGIAKYIDVNAPLRSFIPTDSLIEHDVHHSTWETICKFSEHLTPILYSIKQQSGVSADILRNNGANPVAHLEEYKNDLMKNAPSELERFERHHELYLKSIPQKMAE